MSKVTIKMEKPTWCNTCVFYHFDGENMEAWCNIPSGPDDLWDDEDIQQYSCSKACPFRNRDNITITKK